MTMLRQSLEKRCITGCYGTYAGLLWTLSDHSHRVQSGLHDLPLSPLTKIWIHRPETAGIGGKITDIRRSFRPGSIDLSSIKSTSPDQQDPSPEATTDAKRTTELIRRAKSPGDPGRLRLCADRIAGAVGLARDSHGKASGARNARHALGAGDVAEHVGDAHAVTISCSTEAPRSAAILRCAKVLRDIARSRTSHFRGDGAEPRVVMRWWL